MTTVVRVIDDRVLLKGLDVLYREQMKHHEVGQLLRCAREVCAVLAVQPAQVPVEGYYAESRLLSEYFLRMRALQSVGAEARSRVESLPSFVRIDAVTKSPLFGHPEPGPFLLARGVDPLGIALRNSSPADWNIPHLTKLAQKVARDGDDYSLVGLGAFAGDAVVLAALRETVALYGDWSFGLPDYRYEWRVDPELERRAVKFVATFNELFSDKLPAPVQAAAQRYWLASELSHWHGRCVRIGSPDDGESTQHYHWAIHEIDQQEFVHDFWSADLWTTERFEQHLRSQAPLP